MPVASTVVKGTLTSSGSRAMCATVAATCAGSKVGSGRTEPSACRAGGLAGRRQRQLVAGVHRPVVVEGLLAVQRPGHVEAGVASPRPGIVDSKGEAEQERRWGQHVGVPSASRCLRVDVLRPGLADGAGKVDDVGPPDRRPEQLWF
jgi:hypothetical protein